MATIGLTTRDVARELARRYSTMTHEELDVLETVGVQRVRLESLDPALFKADSYADLEEMATHSSALAWRIPWTEEPGGLQSTGLQRGGHD